MANQNLLLRPEPAPSLTSEATLALPANIAAEAAFLGAVLIDNRVIEELNTPLAPAHFFEPVHTRIYERICQLLDRKAVVTPVTLRPYFEADEALKELGGTAYLARLTSDGQGLLAPRQLAGQIYDLALLRELVSVGRNLVSSAMDTRSRPPKPRSTRWPRGPPPAPRRKASAPPPAPPSCISRRP